MQNYVKEKIPQVDDAFAGIATHNLQRKACIVAGGAVNHKKNVLFKVNEGFDLDHTIFSSVSGMMGFRRMVVKARLCNDEYWNPEAIEQIEKSYEEYSQKQVILKSPNHNDEILRFMETECNFKAEHADGSFMDHLYFCNDYSAVHYKEASPRVMFLHSIMGVGTNVFPMTADKIPMLQDLLNPEEFKQTAAFPSILRLVYHKKLTDELMANKDRLNDLESISFKRVIDNEPIVFTKEELIVALNYQMMHQLDFLPCSNWCTQMKDPFFQVFGELYELTTGLGILRAEVNQDLRSPSEKDENGMPLTLGNFLSNIIPKGLKRKQTIASIQNNSAAIGHDLTYQITWSN